MNLKLDSMLYKNRSVQIAGIRVTDVSRDSEDFVGPGADVAVGKLLLCLLFLSLRHHECYCPESPDKAFSSVFRP